MGISERVAVRSDFPSSVCPTAGHPCPTDSDGQVFWRLEALVAAVLCQSRNADYYPKTTQPFRVDNGLAEPSKRSGDSDPTERRANTVGGSNNLPGLASDDGRPCALSTRKPAEHARGPKNESLTFNIAWAPHENLWRRTEFKLLISLFNNYLAAN